MNKKEAGVGLFFNNKERNKKINILRESFWPIKTLVGSAFFYSVNHFP